jgi:hypothetical protein
MKKEQGVQLFAWSLSIAVSVIAFIAWGQGISWHLGRLSSYRLFPLFGLLAFSLMWSHYIASVVRQYFGVNKGVLHTYFEVTSFAVLTAILVHPGLLAWQLWRDGLGLPPGSELAFVSPQKKLYIIFAFTALTIFLAYEFRRLFHERAWWKYVEYLTDAAMVLIFLHSLNLGSQLQMGWLRPVWYFYGATLGLALIYIYYRKFQPNIAK